MNKKARESMDDYLLLSVEVYDKYYIYIIYM